MGAPVARRATDVRGVERIHENIPGAYVGTDAPEEIVVRQITAPVTMRGNGGNARSDDRQGHAHARARTRSGGARHRVDPGRLSATASAKGRKVAAGSRTVKKAGAASRRPLHQRDHRLATRSAAAATSMSSVSSSSGRPGGSTS